MMKLNDIDEVKEFDCVDDFSWLLRQGAGWRLLGLFQRAEYRDGAAAAWPAYVLGRRAPSEEPGPVKPAALPQNTAQGEARRDGPGVPVTVEEAREALRKLRESLGPAAKDNHQLPKAA